MAGPYASLTSPYAPNHMDSALRIADLISQQGRSAAQAQYAKRMMIGDLISGTANTVGNIFARHDQQKQQAAENQQIADMIASGQPVDLAELLRKFGPERAKVIYSFTEAEIAKKKAAATEQSDAESRQAFVQSVLDDPNASTQAKAAVQLWGKTAGKVTPPSYALPDPKAATDAAAKKRQDEENAEAATLAEAMKHGMSPTDVQQTFISKFGKPLPKEFFAPDAEKATNQPNPTEASLALLAAQGDPAAARALALLRAQKADGGSGTGTGGLPKLTGGQQDDLSTMDTVVDLSQRITEIGDSIGWKGVGGLWTGTLTGAAAKYLGLGSAKEETLRNHIGNVTATIAKLRGGSAFSAAEKEMLDKYTPSVDDADMVIKTKLASLAEFIALKRANTLKYAGGGGPPAGGGVDLARVKQALASKVPNPPPAEPYVLGNGTRWRKNTDGSVQQVP